MFFNEILNEIDAIRKLRDKLKSLSIPQRIVCIVISIFVIILVIWWTARGKDDIVQTYCTEIKKFDMHLNHVNRTPIGIQELASAKEALCTIAKIEENNAKYFPDKKSKELHNRFIEKFDRLMTHFNRMRFSDNEFISREGEELYDKTLNIGREI